MTKVPFQVYLDEKDRSLLSRLADDTRLSKAEVVREAIRRWARELSGMHDPILDLVGTLDDASLPSDLSVRHDEYAVRGYPMQRVAEPDQPLGGDE